MNNAYTEGGLKFVPAELSPGNRPNDYSLINCPPDTWAVIVIVHAEEQPIFVNSPQRKYNGFLHCYYEDETCFPLAVGQNIIPCNGPTITFNERVGFVGSLKHENDSIKTEEKEGSEDGANEA